ncbi:MAG: dihydrolipoyl dehydrogenase [Candidatus Dactylopiibacterium sp.]|nr:dihydrolipoyl dehydrogenase [Candidatus Dactylopiibacterium sp.]
MENRKVEVAIIGAGTAGMAAYRAVRAHTDNLVVIEAGELGTTCARVGCMPSKLLLAAAEAARQAQSATRFGVEVGSVRVAGDRVMGRLHSERERFVAGVLSEVAMWPAEHLLRGTARFVAPGVLEVDARMRVEAARIVIATGSRPVLPPAWRQALGNRLLVSDDVFEWRTLPASVAVAGTGAIGLELALALHALGVRVALYGRGANFGTLTDPLLQTRAQEIFGATLPLHLDDSDIEPVLEAGEVVIRKGGSEERFELLIAAIGREPALEALDLAAGGIPVDEKGQIPFDPATCQVDGLPVFLAGDVDNAAPVLHVAAEEGRVAGQHAARYPEVTPRERQTPMSIVFSQPQIATAGARHAELVARGEDFVCGQVSFSEQGRARLAGQAQGALRVYAARADGRLLGAEMIGPAAEHFAHLIAWAIEEGSSVQALLRRPFYHPVFEEGLRTALAAARDAGLAEAHEGSASLNRMLG